MEAGADGRQPKEIQEDVDDIAKGAGAIEFQLFISGSSGSIVANEWGFTILAYFTHFFNRFRSGGLRDQSSVLFRISARKTPP